VIILIIELLTNEIIVSVLATVIITHIWKVVDGTLRKRAFDWSGFVRTGGMPSSHASFAISLAVAIGVVEGFTSSIFLLSAGLASVVVRDAFGVRHDVDELAKSVNEIIKAKKLGIKEIMRISGHTPIQVVVGGILGIAVPLIVHSLVYL
jgi:acid phosphatase family membrane protein YuiD